jgi:cyclophilin family peptidyl-prolyl cis-trans isomerase
MIRQIRALAALSLFLFLSAQANATIVRFETAMGRFDVNLYDRRTPATVSNFLAYVNSGSFTNVVLHRSVSGFVVQGGAFTFPGSLPFANIVERSAVVNEPLLSNVRGTIAMAKLSGNANSATSQWFINMGNNSANLDVQNGGFTVFGEITAGGMAVLDAINALPTFMASSSIDTLPLRNYTAQDATAGVPITAQHVVFATSVTVLDSNADSAAGLSPVANTLLSPTAPLPAPNAGGGGGATGTGSLVLLGGLALWRRRRQAMADHPGLASSNHAG